MKKACEKWKDQLLEATVTESVGEDLAEHLRTCADCAAELKTLEARRARLDALLPLVARGSEPSTDFRARVLAAAEGGGINPPLQRRWRMWTLAGATATAAIVLVLGAWWYRGTARKMQTEELATAQKLAEWRAPSDSLLATPGQEILRTTPKLGESYLNVPSKKVEEE
jgi:anti-sigma factor RsiW